MKLDMTALMTSGRQCGVAFIIAGLVHGFLGPGSVGEAFVSVVIGFALVLVGSIQISGGNAQ